MRGLLPAVAGLGLLVAACGSHPAAAPTTASPVVTTSPVTPTPTPKPTVTNKPKLQPKKTPARPPSVAATATHPTPVATHPAAPAPPATPVPPAAPAHASYPATLSNVPATASQAITVTAAGYGSTTATYEAWQRSGSVWQLVYGPWTAHLGYHGMAPPGAKREGDGRTPSGVYGFSYLFGIQADPGVHYSWRAVTGTQDVWDDDSSSNHYNEWVELPAEAGAEPEPMDNAPSYDEGAVIAYNTARTPGLGSAIFMHVSDGGTTAGCVSIDESDLTEVLRWMRPGTDISIGLG